MSDPEDHEQLARFMATVTWFNNKRPIEPKLKKELVNYFEYRWTHNLNSWQQEEADETLLSCLPNTQQQNLVLFFFETFLHSYRRYFTMKRYSSVRSGVHYNRFSAAYSGFMM